MILANDEKNGIGKEGSIPWKIPSELSHFKQVTTEKYAKNAVIMGYKTWCSLQRPLRSRLNIVITKTSAHIDSINHLNNDQIRCLNNLDEVYNLDSTYRYWIIGGATIFSWFMDRGLISEIYHTRVRGEYKCDTFYQLPKSVIKGKKDWLSEDIIKHTEYEVKLYTFQNRMELALLNLISNILKHGESCYDRTKIGTVRTFGERLEFSLENNTFPLLTSRRQPFKTILAELLWVLQGETNAEILSRQGIKIWDKYAFGARPENLEINVPQGELGATYGWQLRRFGAKWGTDERGTDQLAEVIRLLKEEPNSRRIIISLWNPKDLRKTVLPPCLMFYQFFVHDGKLSCQFMNRSSDIAVAGGWNISFASLLTIILANHVGLIPDRLIWITGDTHIYLNNVSAARQAITDRHLSIFPKLRMKRSTRTIDDLEKLDTNAFNLFNYKPDKRPVQFIIN